MCRRACSRSAAARCPVRLRMTSGPVVATCRRRDAVPRACGRYYLNLTRPDGTMHTLEKPVVSSGAWVLCVAPR